MARKRIYEIARELGVTSKALIAKLEEMGMPNLKATNAIDDDEHTLIVHLYQEEGSQAAPMPAAPPQEPAVKRPKADVAGGQPRPPIVSVLGHIDHGKTTLLDAIRRSHLAGKEAGGITQGVAAYQADLHGQKITFLDTPGHRAFTGMRARGAQATDIAILVVAADDGVMAQTEEAIDHIQAAGIPMIVAINKIDKANADVPNVINDLAQRGLTPEAWGGDTIAVEISALEGKNVEELLEMILLVAEMENLRADPDGTLEAIIIESHLSVGQGPVATAVVRNGTLCEKQWVVAGSTCGRVRALLGERGQRVRQAIPGEAVSIVGFGEVPAVGTAVVIADSQAKARKLADAQKAEARPRRVQRPTTFEEMFENVEETESLQLVLKAASTGALEAARRELTGLDVEGIELGVVQAGVGGISEGDVTLASTIGGECLVVGFGVSADDKARRLADRKGVVLLTYDIIYDMVDEIERALKRQLGPAYAESEIGSVEVRNLFKIPTGVVAGSYVADGKVTRNSRVRVLRDQKEVFVGSVASLRRFEENVREVPAGRECGIRIQGFDDVQVGDRLVIFELEEVER